MKSALLALGIVQLVHDSIAFAPCDNSVSMMYPLMYYMTLNTTHLAFLQVKFQSFSAVLET